MVPFFIEFILFIDVKNSGVMNPLIEQGCGATRSADATPPELIQLRTPQIVCAGMSPTSHLAVCYSLLEDRGVPLLK